MFQSCVDNLPLHSRQSGQGDRRIFISYLLWHASPALMYSGNGGQSHCSHLYLTPTYSISQAGVRYQCPGPLAVKGTHWAPHWSPSSRLEPHSFSTEGGVGWGCKAHRWVSLKTPSLYFLTVQAFYSLIRGKGIESQEASVQVSFRHFAYSTSLGPALFSYDGVSIKTFNVTFCYVDL